MSTLVTGAAGFLGRHIVEQLLARGEDVVAFCRTAPRDGEPLFGSDSTRVKIITGEAFGLKSPVRVFSPIFYADAQFTAGSSLTVAPEYEDRAVFVVVGSVEVDGETHGDGTMIVLRTGETVTVRAQGTARAMLLGGAPLDGPRHLWWNFVSSSKDRIERAKAEWKAGTFGPIPGDDKEFIPLPD